MKDDYSYGGGGCGGGRIYPDQPDRIDATASLVANRATLEAAKRYIKHVPFVDRGILMAILGMEPDSNADV